MVTMGVFPFQGKTHMVQPGIEPGTSWLVVRSSDHQATRLGTWKEHIAMKRKQLDLKTREIKWLIGKNSPLSLENKILIYKTILKPVWTYGIELWGWPTNPI